eukprot:2059935-Pyramimonas_sp.AAC.1
MDSMRSPRRRVVMGPMGGLFALWDTFREGVRSYLPNLVSRLSTPRIHHTPGILLGSHVAYEQVESIDSQFGPRKAVMSSIERPGGRLDLRVVDVASWLKRTSS